MRSLLFVFVVCLGITCTLSESALRKESSEPLFKINADDSLDTGTTDVSDTFQRGIDAIKKTIESWLESMPMKFLLAMSDAIDRFYPTEYPYFSFMPKYMATVRVGETVSWSGYCMEDSSATLSKTNGELNLELKIHKKNHWYCSDVYLFGNADKNVHLDWYVVAGTKHISFKIHDMAGDSDKNDPAQSIHIFNPRVSVGAFVRSLIETLALFGKERDQALIDMNLEFLKDYAKMPMPKGVQLADIPEDKLRPGDVVFLAELNGLGSIISWEAGSQASHTTMLVRDPKNMKDLYVIESARPHITISPFRDFMQSHTAMKHQIVWTPLDDKLSASFNNTAVWEAFHKDWDGLQYGFGCFISAWLDTKNGNYPSLPYDSSIKMTWPFVQIVVSALEVFSKSTADSMFLQPWNKRVGSEGLSLVQVVRKAKELFGDDAEMPTIPENDDWVYNTTRYGQPVVAPARVCSSFACEMLRIGGVFDNMSKIKDPHKDIQCSEMTPWDVASLEIYQNDEQRVELCPDNVNGHTVCQLAGEYIFYMNVPNMKYLKMNWVDPYPKMAESCPTEASDNFYRPAGTKC